MTMLAEGRYLAALKSGTLTTSRTSKTPQVALVFTLSHEANDGEWVAVQPTDRTVYLALSDAAMEWTDKKLSTLGFAGDFDDMKFIADGLDQVQLICRHDTYNSKTTEKWDLADFGGGAAPEKASSDIVRKMNALWKAKHAAAKAAPAASAPKPAAKTPPPAKPSSGPPKPASDVVASTRDEAWAYICEQLSNKTKEEHAEAWAKAIAKHAKATGRHEGEFDPTDWCTIAEDGAIPF